jgi:DNA-binding NarL/FixJ family response regulator
MNPAPVFLLVDPSPIFRIRLHEWLKSVLTNPCIFLATNGLEALNLAMLEQPSHILIEMDLPDGTGFEVVQQMRKGLPTAKIIATGWYDSRFFLDNVRSAGADGFILKNKLNKELLPMWEDLQNKG